MDSSAKREYGLATLEPLMPSTLSALSTVWMSHGDRITRVCPKGFIALAKSGNSPFAAMGDMQRKYFGVQFHPEVNVTPNGAEVIKHFAVEICGAKTESIQHPLSKTQSNVFENKLAISVCYPQ